MSRSIFGQDHSGAEAPVMRRIQESSMNQVPGMGSAKVLRQESRHWELGVGSPRARGQ